MTTLKIISVNISEKKGTIKKPVSEIELTNNGIINDAHAGNWHRQISMLAQESIDKFTHQTGRKVNYGEFAENITTIGLELYKTTIGDRFVCGEIILEVTQIGKECHGTKCAIYTEVGNCVMPKEGIFCKVIQGGILKAGNSFEYIKKQD